MKSSLRLLTITALAANVASVTTASAATIIESDAISCGENFQEAQLYLDVNGRPGKTADLFLGYSRIRLACNPTQDGVLKCRISRTSDTFPRVTETHEVVFVFENGAVRSTLLTTYVPEGEGYDRRAELQNCRRARLKHFE